MPYTFQGVTHWAVECNYSKEALLRSGVPSLVKARVLRSHMSLERVLEMLDAADLSSTRTITLLHLSDGHSDAAAFKNKIERATGIPVTVAPRERADDSESDAAE